MISKSAQGDRSKSAHLEGGAAPLKGRTMNTLTWVIYLKPVFKGHAMKVICKQTEWDEREIARPGVNIYFQGGLHNRRSRRSCCERTRTGGADAVDEASVMFGLPV
jgi:hypothetical protein